MASTEESKAIHAQWWSYLVKGDLDGMNSLCSDDFRSWSPGRGWIDKKQTREFSDWFRTLLVDGWFEFEPPLITAEGERVCCATSSVAKLKNGNVYNNYYHFLHVIRDGKIVESREYNDSLHVWSVLEREITDRRAAAAANAALVD